MNNACEIRSTIDSQNSATIATSCRPLPIIEPEDILNSMVYRPFECTCKEGYSYRFSENSFFLGGGCESKIILFCAFFLIWYISSISFSN